MVTINLDDKSVENFKAIRELQSMGYSDEQIQKWYEKICEALPDCVGALTPLDVELVEQKSEVEYAEWCYDPNGMDWGLGAWKCSKCHTKNDNLGGSKNINPYIFAGSKFCPQCGAVMKPKESDK